MPSTIHVGIWSIDTCSPAAEGWLRKPLGQKLIALNQALSAFFRFRITQGNVATTHEPNTVRAIFAAPEYFLAGTRNEEHDRYYVDEVTSRSFVNMIPGPTNTLLVPGSIAKLKRATGSRATKYTTNVPALDTGDKKTFIRNTAYGFLHARKVLSCSKQGNATDGFADTDPELFVPGWKTNKAQLTVHDTGGPPRLMRFAIEICADASQHRPGVPGYVDTTDTAPVDVKILVSAALPTAAIFHGNYTRALIHAASEPQYSGIDVKGANTATHIQRQRFMGHQLDFYRLTMP